MTIIDMHGPELRFCVSNLNGVFNYFIFMGGVMIAQHKKREIAYFSLGAEVISWSLFVFSLLHLSSWLIKAYTNVPQAAAILNTAANKPWVVSFEYQKHHVQMPPGAIAASTFD
jgi:hypothetical protein